jgi:hypothetical protein
LQSNLPRGGIDEQKLEIGAIEISGSNTGDTLMLPHLLNQIRRDQQIGSGTAPSRQIASQSPVGRWMAHMTRADATTPSLTMVRLQ